MADFGFGPKKGSQKEKGPRQQGRLEESAHPHPSSRDCWLENRGVRKVRCNWVLREPPANPLSVVALRCGLYCGESIPPYIMHALSLAVLGPARASLARGGKSALRGPPLAPANCVEAPPSPRSPSRNCDPRDAAIIFPFERQVTFVLSEPMYTCETRVRRARNAAQRLCSDLAQV